MALIRKPISYNAFYELFIDSRDRVSGSLSDFVINLEKPLTIRQICLMEAEIPFLWYVVNGTNNELTFNDGTSDLTVILTQGNYNGIQLATAIQAGIVATGTAVTPTITFSTITQKMTLAFTSNVTLKFGTGTRSIGTILGFAATDVSGTSFTGTNRVNLMGDTACYISMFLEPTINATILNPPQTTAGTYPTIRVPIDVNPGNVICYKPLAINVFDVASVGTTQQIEFLINARTLQTVMSDYNVTLKLGIFT